MGRKAACLGLCIANAIQGLYLPSFNQYVSYNGQPSSRMHQRQDYWDTATDAVKSMFPYAEFRVAESRTLSDGSSQVYFQQTLHHLDIVNADIKMNFYNDTISSYHTSFFGGEMKEFDRPEISCTGPIDALKAVVKKLDLPIDLKKAKAERQLGGFKKYIIKGTSGARADPRVDMVYIRTDDDKIALAWQVDTDFTINWLISYVDVHNSKKVYGIVDLVSSLVPWDYDSAESRQKHGTRGFAQDIQGRSDDGIDEIDDIGVPDIFQVPNDHTLDDRDTRDDGDENDDRHYTPYSFRVYPWPTDPLTGDRTIVPEPYHSPWVREASPIGWTVTGDLEYANQTLGNNVFVSFDHKPFSCQNLEKAECLHSMTDKELSRAKAEGLFFDSKYSPDMEEPTKYRDASAIQLFYTVNMCHDLFYSLGFDETAYNFQKFNLGRGGVDDDGIVAVAQSRAATSRKSAFFGSSKQPPGSTNKDSQMGEIHMDLRKQGEDGSYRDSAFDSGIVLHEYTHGVSRRSTSWEGQRNCFNNLQSKGISEGWSDFFPMAVQVSPSGTRADEWVLGAFYSGRKKGLRQYPYTTNKEVNPLTYRSAWKMKGEHDIGMVFNTMLTEVLWNLIDKYGNNPAEFPTMDDRGQPTDGRFLAMKLVYKSMARSTCNVQFSVNEIRQPLIMADEELTGGENFCEIDRALAKRGFGAKADWNKKEDFKVDKRCRE